MDARGSRVPFPRFDRAFYANTELWGTSGASVGSVCIQGCGLAKKSSRARFKFMPKKTVGCPEITPPDPHRYVGIPQSLSVREG